MEGGRVVKHPLLNCSVIREMLLSANLDEVHTDVMMHSRKSVVVIHCVSGMVRSVVFVRPQKQVPRLEESI